ncbi:DMT family transporter, partial [Nocardioides sp.]|uniref:DMT family transporter n=1 Tax=Nocardioides sp. TaxID=35761 RepID=UPI0027373264
ARTTTDTAGGAVACTVAMSLVGASIAIAPALAGYPVLAGQAWRYLLAGVILLGVLVARPAPGTRLATGVARRTREALRALTRISTANALRVLAIAITGLALFNWLLIEGTRHADPAFLAAIVGATPLVLALVGPVAAGRPIAPRTVLGGAVVAVGIVLVHGATAAPLVALPYGLAFLACEVAFTLLAVPVLFELTPVQLSAAACLVATPLLAVVSVASSEAVLQVPTLVEAAALLYMAVFTTAVAFLLWYGGVARLGADRAGLFVGVMPVAGYLTGLTLGSSAWALTALVGVGLCGAGVVLGLAPPTARPVPSPRGGEA